MVSEIVHTKIVDYYKASLALIYPSYRESFGLPLVEAAYLSMPLLASKRDHVEGFVFPTVLFDPDSPISIMNAVISNTAIVTVNVIS